MNKCVVCQGENPKFALPLVREEGKWTVKPICGRCRYGLEKEARSQKKFIPMYKLEASLNEVLHRNAEIGKLSPFLAAFARQAKVVRKDDKKSAVAKDERKRWEEEHKHKDGFYFEFGPTLHSSSR